MYLERRRILQGALAASLFGAAGRAATRPDARAAGKDFPIPFFVIQGREDTRMPPAAARAFVNEVHAPVKRYTEIEGGHFAYMTNPAGFLNMLDSDLRTLKIG